MKAVRFRVGALLVCALVAFDVVSATDAADSTSPTVTVAVSPAAAAPGSTVTITATVTPGTNPDSTGLTVNCDLSWAGLSQSTPLTADASGLVFTRAIAVPSAAVPGPRMGSCTVTDDQTRHSSALYTFTVSAPATDAAPTVASHTPDADETDVARDANIGIVFSEPVTVTGSWYAISCKTSGTHAAAVSGGPTSYLLNPTSDFAAGEECTVTLDPALITDQDASDPPDNLEGATSWTFTIAAPVNQPPSVRANGPYAVDEGSTVHLSASGSDPEGGALTYAWDLDGNGSYETSGQSVDVAAPDGPASRTVGVRATDAGGLTATASTTVSIANVAPTATLSAPTNVDAGAAFTLALTQPDDPSPTDAAAGFTYAFDCGSGYGAFGAAASVSCAGSDAPTLSVGAKIRDKDGGVSEYRAAIQIGLTYAGLCSLVHELVADPAVAVSLCAKLAAAAHAEERGNSGAADNQLRAFRNEVDAQAGKSIAPADALLLKMLSERL